MFECHAAKSILYEPDCGCAKGINKHIFAITHPSPRVFDNASTADDTEVALLRDGFVFFVFFCAESDIHGLMARCSAGSDFVVCRHRAQVRVAMMYVIFMIMIAIVSSDIWMILHIDYARVT